MHQSSMLRMEWFLEKFVGKNHPSPLKILDVGSYDVNGTYRKLLPDDQFEYIGMDMETGPNVDLVVETPYSWPQLETDSFDIVISGQAFEHNEFFWLTMEEIARILKPGGLVCIIAPNGFEEHRFPVDCYRFFTDGMMAMARYVQLDVLHASTNAFPEGKKNTWHKKGEEDAMMVAQKNYSGPAKIVDRKSYSCQPAEQEKFLSGLKPFQNPQENLIQKLLMKIYRKMA